MPVAELRLFLDNNAAGEERLGLFSEVRVDQAIGMAAEAELTMDIGTDETGLWSGMEEEFIQPFARVRLEVKIREGEFVPLIDGPVVGQRFELSASPNSSKMVLVVQDDSVLLNQVEEVVVFEDKEPDQIARTLFSQYGLTARTDSVSGAAGGLTRYTVQRGTAMHLLRKLARSNGMFVYVQPGDRPGNSIGVFKRPDLTSGDYPDLLLTGAARNINTFSADFDGLRPFSARADAVDITDLSQVTGESEDGTIEPQGDEAVHDILEPRRALLARTGAEETALEAATAAAVDHSSWAYSASSEVVADTYNGVLRPYTVITVTGVGGYLSGDWLISKVTHTINDAGYKQQFSLRRNARSAGANSNSGGIGGGIF